jgi:hypothetical protein
VFTKLKEASVPTRKQNFMSYPIKKEDGELYLTIQAMSKKKSKSVFYAGFTMIDEIFLHLISNVF